MENKLYLCSGFEDVNSNRKLLNKKRYASLYLRTSEILKVSQGWCSGFTLFAWAVDFIRDTGIPKTFKYNVTHTAPRFFR